MTWMTDNRRDFRETDMSRDVTWPYAYNLTFEQTSFGISVSWSLSGACPLLFCRLQIPFRLCRTRSVITQFPDMIIWIFCSDFLLFISLVRWRRKIQRSRRKIDVVSCSINFHIFTWHSIRRRTFGWHFDRHRAGVVYAVRIWWETSRSSVVQFDDQLRSVERFQVFIWLKSFF